MKQQHFNEKKSFRFKRFVRKSYSAFNSMHKTVTIGVVSSCILTFAHTGTASAQSQAEAQQHPELMEKELDEVTVTGSLANLPLNQTAKTVTIISQQQIDQAPVQNIQDLLIYVAGIDVMQRGMHGVQADISIRGGLADQTAILLNGINLSNSQTGHYNFDIPINLSDIERIEIIQGSSSLIYGASAFSGGINIITKKDADTKAYIRLGSGMHDLYEAETKAILTTGIATNQLSLGYNTSGGYIANSDYDIYNALWQTRLNLKSDNKIDVQLGYNNKRYGANTFYSAAYPNQYERTDTYLSTVKGTFGSKIKIVPAIYWTRHHNQFDLIKNTTTGRNYHRNDTYGSSLNFLYKSKLGTTGLGSELRREEILSSKLGQNINKPHGAYYTKYDGRTNTSFALEHSANIEKFVFSVGTMINHNTLQKGKYYLYPSVSASYNPTEKVKIYSSWSKATRMPTFTDLYYSTETHIGNEKLKPEKSETFELGAKYRNRLMSVYATAYIMEGRNMIDWVREQPTDKWKSWNHTKIDKRGIELGSKFKVGEIWNVLGRKSNLSLDYVRLHQSRNKIDLESIYALNYLRDKFTANLNHKLFYDELTIGWYFRYQKRMGQYNKYKNGVPTGMHSFPSFSTLDLKVSYQLQNINFNISINNLYDKDYFDVGNIAQPGFWLMGGISYTIK